LLWVLLIDLVSSCSMWHQPVDGAGPRLISLHSFMLSFHAVCFALPIDCPTLHMPEHTDFHTAPQQFSAVKAACMCQVNASIICLHKAADPHCYVVSSRAILAFTCISSAHSLWPLPYTKLWSSITRCTYSPAYKLHSEQLYSWDTKLCSLILCAASEHYQITKA